MGKIQNIFAKGIINKDSQARFVDSAELIDAENFFVVTTEGNSQGVGKNALGNLKRTNLNIPGAKTMGTGKNSSKNKVYNFIKATIYDYLIEYDVDTHVSVIVLQSTTGTRLNLKTGERILNVDIISSGEPYDPVTGLGGDLISWSGDSNPPRIGNIERMKTWGTDGFTAEEIMLIKAPPLYPPLVVLVNTVDEKENFLKDKFLSFATRYKYKDDYYSAISSWQEYQFSPDNFQLDISSCENKGMINTFNACDISFNTGPREVQAIELLFRFSNSETVYRVDRFVKTEEGWGNNITIPTPIRFANNKVFSILPEDQYFRSFDNVPENSVAATVAGNRQMYANYKEGKNLIDKYGDPVVMNYKVDFISIDPQSVDVPITKLATASIFDGLSIADGKIRLDFTGVELVKDASVALQFNLRSIAVSPPLTPARPIYNFNKTYGIVLSQDYANITALVADTANGFESGIEGYLSDLFLSSLVYPEDSLDFPPSLFNGFTLAVISTNVIDIVFPSMKYEIEVLPSGPNTFVKEYIQDSGSIASKEAIGSKKSMKSYRGYEVVMLYRDAQGRKITAPSSAENNIFIPISKSESKNILTVDMQGLKPPSLATTYKFAVKPSKGTYEEIYTTDFYEDGYFRWVRLEGASKNKVKEGDLLLVKRDSSGVIKRPITVSVLDIKNQEQDFIIGSAIVELAGLYMKIKPEGFDMPYNPDSYKEFLGFEGKRSGHPSVTLTIPNSTLTNNIPEGSIMTIELSSNFSNESEFNNYSTTIIASSDYPDFQTFYNVQINSMVFQGNNTSVDFGGVFPKSSPGVDKFKITGTSDGRDTVINPKSGFLNVKLTLRTTAGFMVFETQGTEVDDVTFFETPEVFPIVDGEHVYDGENVTAGVHRLVKTFNCFSQGNGAESYQIRDAFNEKYVRIDYLQTVISEDGAREINRSCDITYSGVYNSSSNVNRLNEFNLYLANYKDDIDKSYGSIYKIKGEDTNLQVFQEEKDSQVFYGKDILYNADGSSNLSKISDVLGSQDDYLGDWGISSHPDSYDKDGFNAYHTDAKKGVVLKKSNNGLFEVSGQGMRSYFQALFRDNKINHINGKYDTYNGFYILNIQYNDTEYVTWAYSDKDNGWLGRMTFNPEDMIRINSKFISFKNGEVYEHNSAVSYNTFYGVESPSTFTFNFSQNPSERKTYKVLEIEGTDAWKMVVNTDLSKGFVNKEDFVRQEGVFYAYIRTSNDAIDSSLLSCQGIGNASVAGLVLNFSFDLDDVISVGDTVRNSNLESIGVILSKTKRSLTLDAMNNISNGDFVLCSKTQSVANGGLLGYHLEVHCSLSKNTKTEVYAINSEVVKSYS
jgi:hypothetical protein